jgi:hypothetical protein
MRKIETIVRPASLTDFQMLSNADISYNAVATTKEDLRRQGRRGVKHNVAQRHRVRRHLRRGRRHRHRHDGQPGQEVRQGHDPTIRSVIANPINFASFMASLVDIQARRRRRASTSTTPRRPPGG